MGVFVPNNSVSRYNLDLFLGSTENIMFRLNPNTEPLLKIEVIIVKILHVLFGPNPRKKKAGKSLI